MIKNFTSSDVRDMTCEKDPRGGFLLTIKFAGNFNTCDPTLFCVQYRLVSPTVSLEVQRTDQDLSGPVAMYAKVAVEAALGQLGEVKSLERFWMEPDPGGCRG